MQRAQELLESSSRLGSTSIAFGSSVNASADGEWVIKATSLNGSVNSRNVRTNYLSAVLVGNNWHGDLAPSQQKWSVCTACVQGGSSCHGKAFTPMHATVRGKLLRSINRASVRCYEGGWQLDAYGLDQRYAPGVIIMGSHDIMRQ